MSVWIVIVNGKVHAVFDNPEAAEAHRLAMQKLWSLTSVIEQEVRKI